MGRRGPKPQPAAVLLARGSTLAKGRLAQERAGTISSWQPEHVQQLFLGTPGPFGDPAETFDFRAARTCWRDCEIVATARYHDWLTVEGLPPEPPWFGFCEAVRQHPMRTLTGRVVRLPHVYRFDHWHIWASPPGEGIETRLSYLLRHRLVDLSAWKPTPAAIALATNFIADMRNTPNEFRTHEIASAITLYGEALETALTDDEREAAEPHLV